MEKLLWFYIKDTGNFIQGEFGVMANLWLDTFLGKTGKIIIQFIDNYYLYLVPVILLYGIFMTLSSFNLKRIEKYAVREIIRQARHIIKVNPRINYADLIYYININWEAVIIKGSFFPFISTEAGFWVNRTNMFNVRETVMHDDKKLMLVFERNKICLEESRQELRKNLYTEYFHRITRQK